jgi:hypothetical protein
VISNVNINMDTAQYVVCVKNEGYPASLELRKIYHVVPDIQAAEHQMLRVIDESGEDYLCPASYFVPIELPQALETLRPQRRRPP